MRFILQQIAEGEFEVVSIRNVSPDKVALERLIEDLWLVRLKL